MNEATVQMALSAQEKWLKRYYFARAGFSIAWVGTVLALVPEFPRFVAFLLALYPAWDALANMLDGHRSGSIAVNQSQTINAAVSLVVTGAIAFALPDMYRVFAVFGTWAILSGVLQLTTALQRRKTNRAQWAMVLSGAQSALAGVVFVFQASAQAQPTVATIAAYAGFGALYFLAAALSLTVRSRYRNAE